MVQAGAAGPAGLALGPSAPLRVGPLPAALGPPAAVRGQRAQTLVGVRPCSGRPLLPGGFRPPLFAHRRLRPAPSRGRSSGYGGGRGPPAPALPRRAPPAAWPCPRPCPAVGSAPSPWFGPWALPARRASVTSGPRGSSPRRLLGRSAPGPGGFRGRASLCPRFFAPAPGALWPAVGGGCGGGGVGSPLPPPARPPPLGAPGSPEPVGWASPPRWSGSAFCRPSPAGPPCWGGAPGAAFPPRFTVWKLSTGS